MTIRVGINGFGRIGRNFFRAAKKAGADIDFVAVNDLGSVDTMAHLLKYDSVMGQLDNDVEATDDGIKVDGDLLKVLAVRDPEELPWGDLGVDVVVESTGIFTGARQGRPPPRRRRPVRDRLGTVLGRRRHLRGGRQRRHLRRRATQKVVSNASCTTNCFVPMVKVLDDAFGVERGLMTTVHAYTGDQSLVDGPHSDLRRARAAAINIIPTVARAPPGRPAWCSSRCRASSTAQSLRVPVPTGSITDFTGVLARDVTVDEVNEAFAAAACAGPLAGVARVLRGAARVERHRRLARLVHLRQRAHQSIGQPGQGVRLVRQRVGLLEPPGRSRRDRRRRQQVSGRRDRQRSDAGGPPARSAGKRVLLRADFNVPIRDGADHRRPAHPGRPAHHRVAAGPGRPCRGLHPPGPAQGQARPRVLGRAGARAAGRAGAGRRAAREPALRPGRGGQRPGVRRPAGRGLRRLRQRRLRGLAPGARVDRGAAADLPSARRAPARRGGRGARAACGPTRSGPSSPSSAAPR